MFCVECGKKIETGWKFCQSCGAKIGNTEPVKSEKCVSGKKYVVVDREIARAQSTFQRNSELKDTFWNGAFTILEDGTQVGFKWGHTEKYKGSKDFYYNLYRLDTDGTATFLNTGIRGCIEEMYVLDGYAYCEWGACKIKADING